MKRSFVFNIDWRDVLMDYPAEVRYEVYDAIIEYAASGKLLELKPLAKMAFSFIKKEMDYNNERYQEKVMKNRENGKKGGAPKGNNNAKAKQPKQPNGYPNNPKQPKTTQNNPINDNEYDNDIKENTPNGVQKKDPPPKTPFDKFNDWLRENTPNVMKLKTQITEEQFSKIRGTYTFQQIADILLAMENYKELTKKYTSVYLTFLKWAKKDYGTN